MMVNMYVHTCTLALTIIEIPSPGRGGGSQHSSYYNFQALGY